MAVTTLLDIVKMNGSDAAAGLLEEAQVTTPEISGMTIGMSGQMVQVPGVGDSRTITGTMYKTLVRTALPSVGFRDANEGTPHTKSTYENRIVNTFIMNPQWSVDKAVGDRHEDGWQTVMAQEATGHTMSALITVAKQFYYGTLTTNGAVGSAKGFPGLLQTYSTSNEVDAGGTTEDTCSSVWLVKFGPDYTRWVFGNGGMFDPSDVSERGVKDSGGTNEYTAYFQELLAYPGLQVNSQDGIVRIKKLTADAGAGLTDARLYSALEKFKSHVRPDAVFASRRSIGQLRASRTATNTTGAPAPYPTDIDGIPIIATDSLVNTEKLAL